MLHSYSLELVTMFVSIEQELIEYTYDHDALDLANLETETLLAIHALPNKSLALFAADGSVLILAQIGDSGFKVKSALKLSQQQVGIEDDSMEV